MNHCLIYLVIHLRYVTEHLMLRHILNTDIYGEAEERRKHCASLRSTLFE